MALQPKLANVSFSILCVCVCGWGGGGGGGKRESSGGEFKCGSCLLSVEGKQKSWIRPESDFHYLCIHAVNALAR